MPNLAQIADPRMMSPQRQPMPQAGMQQTLSDIANSGQSSEPIGLRPSGNVERADVQQERTMITILQQSPTPEVAGQVVQKLQSLNNPNANIVAEQIMKVANNPEQLQALTQKILSILQ